MLFGRINDNPFVGDNLFGQRSRSNQISQREYSNPFLTTHSISEEEMNKLNTCKYVAEEGQCTICQENLKKGEDVMYLICFHCFH